MSGVIKEQEKGASNPPVLSGLAEAELDPQQALYAHLIGLCSGALILLGTAAAVCAVVHWL